MYKTTYKYNMLFLNPLIYYLIIFLRGCFMATNSGQSIVTKKQTTYLWKQYRLYADTMEFPNS